jgi:hypothetical protein
VPLAVAGDCALRRAAGERVVWHASLLAALVAAVALFVAGSLWLFGLGVGAFAVALAGVALIAALLGPRPVPAAGG